MQAKALILAAVWACSGCAAFKPKPLDPGIFMLAPQEAGVELAVTQILKFSKDGKVFEALAAIELSPAMLSMAALGPMGNRVLALSWDGKKLEQERDPSIPAELPLELILRDMQLALWPAGAVQQAVSGKGWVLTDQGRERILSKNGSPVVRIRYGGDDRWHSSLKFEHLGLAYQLEIQSVKEDE